MSTQRVYRIGTQYRTRGKHGRLCTVTEVFRTYNSQDELVNVTYESQHAFCGQMVTDRGVIATTIAMGLVETPGTEPGSWNEAEG